MLPECLGGDPVGGETEQAEAVLSARADEVRATLPATPPQTDLGVALWAARQLYGAAFGFAHRETPAEEIARWLGQPSPQPSAGDPDLGADLVFVFAPDLLRLAAATATADPLVTALTDLLRAWPLSSVGVPNASPDPAATPRFWSERSLRLLYIDRIIAQRDLVRLANPEVREAVAAVLGAHPELAPEVAAAIDRIDSGGESQPDG